MLDDKLMIVPDEAEVVRQIYNMYLSGMGKAKIAKMLTIQGVPAPHGGCWAASSVYNILRNEKYTGDMMLQKYHVPDFREKHTKPNRGEVRQYFVENSHEAIIERGTFQRVQDEIERRSKTHCYPHREKRKDQQNLFTGLIRCGFCGHLFVRNQTSGKKYKPPVWICPTFLTLGKGYCPSQKIPESILLDKAKEILGVDTVSREFLEANLSCILVPEHNRLTLLLKDGNSVDMPWKHPSRSLSWTPEMRQAARERAKRQYRKEEA